MHAKHTIVLGFCFFTFKKYDGSLNKKVIARSSPNFIKGPRWPWVVVNYVTYASLNQAQ